MRNPPLVSINIRTFNSEGTLQDTLESVKSQSYSRIEILVADGFSKDRSVEIAKKYRAKVLFVEKLGDARYENYKQSHGKYILSLDSDQLLSKELIDVCVRKCEKEGYDALTIAEQSLTRKGTFLEKLIAYDKWIIHKNQDANVTFGTACPRFFRKELLADLRWPKGLALFDDTILYEELLKKGAKTAYVSNHFIKHYEVTSWVTFFKKFYRYGKGYFRAFSASPATIAAHSLPRRSYFSRAAFSKPYYFLGLILLYTVKATAAGLGVLSCLLQTLLLSKKTHFLTLLP